MLLPFLLAIVLAYVLSPVVNAGQQLRFGGRATPRWVVVLVLYLALVGVLDRAARGSRCRGWARSSAG